MADKTDPKPQEPKEEAPQEEPKDRTGEQFEKLTESNKELKEQKDKEAADKQKALEEAEKYKKLYEASELPQNPPPAPKGVSENQVQDVMKELVDKDGYLDGGKLGKILTDLSNKATTAEKEAQAAREEAINSKQQLRDFEEKRASREVFKKYPALDPKGESFDPRFFKYVKNNLLARTVEQAKAGEQPSEKDYMEVAEAVHKDLYGDKEVTKKEKEEQAEVQEAKAASTGVTPTGSTMNKGYYDNAEEDELIKAVRQNKKGAVAERLRRREAGK